MSNFIEHVVWCNGVKVKKQKGDAKCLILDHRDGAKDKNVNLNLRSFVTDIYKLSNRGKDLLEIAGYVFAADRLSYRGHERDLEYHSWSRTFHFNIAVRDLNFWKKAEVQELLSEALCFMSGDHSYSFTFCKAEEDLPTNFFDNDSFKIDKPNNLKVALYSGGLDSLAGIIESLETTDAEVCMVSHQSGQPGVINTQQNLYEVLANIYPNRCKHYKFHCGFSHTKSIDETQRTRSFLYTATAFAIANTYEQDCIYVYENGITSINFADTQDLMNARASRTTHPKTIGLLEKLFTKIAEKPFKIQHPYLFKTKTEVVDILKKYNREFTLDVAVSCSSTRNHPSGFSHCGICSQCIDRRFAVYAAEVEKFDEGGLYHTDFVKNGIDEIPHIKALTDYIRLAQEFKDIDIDGFYLNRAREIVDVEEYIEGADDQERLMKIYELTQKHSKNIEHALNQMRRIFDSPLAHPNPNSIFNTIIAPRTYQNVKLVVEDDYLEGKEIPPKTMKKLATEACESLVRKELITDVLDETRKNRPISTLVVTELRRKGYKVTQRQANTINDYFRKAQIQIKKENNGGLKVVSE
ncbi:MAG: hypothetical protein A2499_01300 [Stygiobacter sp. RIFOXYC12_FULL_38_8]|nr:MAG: hypothetical protein A2279_10615 [Stygiobacter sp. RIFOXYA12_FULL_38_9]OGV09630.1 MAG: hypothetical protein A2299_00835 [Stygiobacter sp. RIFOXYB2_FULL_37_11]OGV16760.1 MAG: hypothetical protein A2440_05305 [Stygiobacter sp. RIFOXYC2_FULL_38_25]OGV29451.1 MAG: hypothetical protein A2499_01300 [Stygiobacter sp. RIFOXYC12_FULL_38_8]OGV82889.1 MAG: hypothetical protein A2X65_12850 [Stygiobacter sp. GWF2_38_21]RJQ61656.1 MAG: hypothetical protein C4517_07825 [Stygiobacter sp.]